MNECSECGWLAVDGTWDEDYPCVCSDCLDGWLSFIVQPEPPSDEEDDNLLYV